MQSVSSVNNVTEMEDKGTLGYFVSVQEKYIYMQIAIDEWKNENVQPLRRSDLEIVSYRAATATSCNVSRKKRPRCFKTIKTCSMKKGVKLQGGTLPKGRVRASNWGDCCYNCFKRGDCKTWTFASKTRLCYLKGGSPRIRKLRANRTYMTGHVFSKLYAYVLIHEYMMLYA